MSKAEPENALKSGWIPAFPSRWDAFKKKISLYSRTLAWVRFFLCHIILSGKKNVWKWRRSCTSAETDVESCSPLGTEVDEGAANSAEDTLLLTSRSVRIKVSWLLFGYVNVCLRIPHSQFFSADAKRVWAWKCLQAAAPPENMRRLHRGV